MKKKPLHQPPPEMVKALAIKPERRALKRNEHTQGGSSYTWEELDPGRTIRRATRRHHRVPLPGTKLLPKETQEFTDW